MREIDMRPQWPPEVSAFSTPVGLRHYVEPVTVDSFVVDPEWALPGTLQDRRHKGRLRHALKFVHIGHAHLHRNMTKAMNDCLKRPRGPRTAYEELYAVELRRSDMLLEIIKIVEGEIINNIAVRKYGDRRASRGRSRIGQSRRNKTEDNNTRNNNLR